MYLMETYSPTIIIFIKTILRKKNWSIKIWVNKNKTKYRHNITWIVPGASTLALYQTPSVYWAKHGVPGLNICFLWISKARSKFDLDYSISILKTSQAKVCFGEIFIFMGQNVLVAYNKKNTRNKFGLSKIIHN